MQGRGRHHDFKERFPALGLGPDKRAEPGSHHRWRKSQDVAAALERTQQRQATDAVAGRQGYVERDDSAHGVAYQVRGRPALSVHQSQSVLRHLLNGEARAEGLAAAQTAIVKGEAFVMRREGIDLRGPSAAMHADALNENRGRPSAMNFVGEAAVLMGVRSMATGLGRSSVHSRDWVRFVILLI